LSLVRTDVDVSRLLRSAVRRYYEQRRIDVPDLPKREFGYSVERGRKIQTRHVSFADAREFNTFLRREAPLYVSYSVALYRRPSAKDYSDAGYLGADWVFEFDMEHIIAGDVIYCPKCGGVYYGEELLFSDPSKCPKCGSDTHVLRVPDPKRFSTPKKYTLRLIRILREDFGLSRESIRINFSGNRGFHIHVIDEEWEEFPPEARVEIAQYISLSEIDPCQIVESVSGHPAILYVGGIHKRLADMLMPRFPHAVVGERVVFDVDMHTFRRALEAAMESIAVPIDIHTTTDVRRLIRVPDTVHGGTGLVAKRIDHDELMSFNPYKDAVLPIGHTITAYVKYLPEIEWMGERYGPYEDETVELPVTLVLYLTS